VIITGGFRAWCWAADYFQFHKVKMDTATLAVVSVSLCDNSPCTAWMVAGRRGASIAAENRTIARDRTDDRCGRWPRIRWIIVVPRILGRNRLPLLATEPS